MIVRGKQTLLGEGKNDSQIQVAMTTREAERMEPYGLHTSPPNEKEAVALFIGGDLSNGIHFLTNDDQEKPELKEGEVSIYRDKDNYVKLGNSTTEVKRNGMSLTITDDGRLSIQNKKGDFMEILTRIIHAIKDHETPTGIGLQTSPKLMADMLILLKELEGVLK